LKISLITIAFNSVETIEATLISVIEQDYSQVEYIIVDGGSTDGTLEILDKYKAHISTIVSEPDKGLYDAMNKGIGLSSGDIVGILNSDDLYASKDVISEIVKCFEGKDVEGVYANLQYVDRYDTTLVKRTWISGPYEIGDFTKGWMPPHPTFFVKKEKYNQLGTYNTSLKTSADYELMLRFIHKHGIKLSYLNKVITLMRTGGQSNVSFKNRLKANKEDRLAWQINGLKPGLFTHIRKPLSKISQFFKK